MLTELSNFEFPAQLSEKMTHLTENNSLLSMLLANIGLIDSTLPNAAKSIDVVSKSTADKMENFSAIH